MTESTSAFVERPFGSADLPAAERLVAQAGWNQVADDWRIFLDFGRAIALTDAGGGLVATAATLPYEAFAWISMVLVDERARRRGIATRLLARCVDLVRSGGRVPILDATPAGREVYRRIGFRDLDAITRWQRPSGAATAVVPSARALRDADWPALLALDSAAFGADRSPLLGRLRTRSPVASVIESGGTLAGYVLGRDGRVATQLGPLAASSESAAIGLLDRALGMVEGPVFLDALDRHAGLAHALAARGFVTQRSFTRMAHETDAPRGDASRYFLIAGPELG